MAGQRGKTEEQMKGGKGKHQPKYMCVKDMLGHEPKLSAAVGRWDRVNSDYSLRGNGKPTGRKLKKPEY